MLQWLVKEFARNLRTELAPLLERPEDFDCLAIIQPPSVEDDSPVQWWTQSFDAAPDIALSIGISQALCQEIRKNAPRWTAQNGASGDILPVLVEAIGEASTAVARRLSELLKDLVQPGDIASADAPPTEGTSFTLELRFGGETRQHMKAWLNRPFTEYLEKLPADLLFGAQALDDTGRVSSGVLRALMDVEMPVAISLGKSRLPFNEVLTLSSGSVVQMDRQLTDPVDVLVNGHVIARGEIVLVEGNYGVRIQSICGNGIAESIRE